MSLTNQELYQAVDRDAVITEEMTDIFKELDSTVSTTTQASLNEMLVILYNRLSEEEIVIERFGDEPCTQEDFAAWIEDEFDDYTKGLFVDATD